MSDLDRLIQARLKKARKEAEAAEAVDLPAADEAAAGSEPARSASSAGRASDLDALIAGRQRKARKAAVTEDETALAAEAPARRGLFAAPAEEVIEIVPADEATLLARERLAGLVAAAPAMAPAVLEDAVLAAPPPEVAEREDAAFERRLMKTLGAVALLAVILSVAANVSWARVPRAVGDAELARVPALRYQPQLDLEKAAVELLPSEVLAYETIARHGVPGEGKRAAEALYATMNMELDVQVPISVYARVEGFATGAEAAEHAKGILSRYPVKPESFTTGSTPMKSGYREDQGAWAVVWTKGQYSVYLKTSFKDKVPYEKRDFLRNVARPVLQAIEKYQRTGKEGLKL